MTNSDFLPVIFNDVELIVHRKACLSGVNFTISSTGITVIMGSNGSGKTLLLKLLAGVISATTGSINWHKQPQPPTLTMVPAKAVLLNRSVRENIALPLRYQIPSQSARRSISKGDSDTDKTKNNTIDAALAWANIAYLQQRQAKSLSTGEQQLVALARAWALKPRILLLDEITANLDPVRTQKINALIQDLSSSCKVILSTHSIKQAKDLADDVILLEQGCIVLHTDADTFFKSDELQQFLGFL
jgi:tungstate transport system ATP-binding protein